MWSLNFIATAFMALVVANLFITASAHAPESPELRVMAPPISVGKQRSFSSGRDASMYTQQVRRRAIVNAHFGSPDLVLRESNHTSGFTNGVIEIYSITGICQRLFKSIVVSNIYDGGTESSEYTDQLNAGTSGGPHDQDRVLDAGNEGTVVAPYETVNVAC